MALGAVLTFAGDWGKIKTQSAKVSALVEAGATTDERLKSLENRHVEIMTELRYLRRRIDQLLNEGE